MTFDQTIALWCLGVPALLVLLGSLATRWMPERFAAIVIGVIWFAAVAIAQTARQGFEWWPEDAWRLSLWSLLVWATFMPATEPVSGAESEPRGSDAAWRWVFAAAFASLTAALAMPTGEAWTDTLVLHRTWIPLTTLSVLANAYALRGMSSNGAERWCLLVATAGLGTPFALAAATYGSLAECALVMTVSTLGLAIVGLTGWSPTAWVAVYPSVAGAAVVTASSRFYTYDDYPAWVYGIALFMPLVLSLVDACLRSRPTWQRMVVSAVLAIVLIGVCVWRVLLSEPY